MAVLGIQKRGLIKVSTYLIHHIKGLTMIFKNTKLCKLANLLPSLKILIQNFVCCSKFQYFYDNVIVGSLLSSLFLFFVFPSFLFYYQNHWFLSILFIFNLSSAAFHYHIEFASFNRWGETKLKKKTFYSFHVYKDGTLCFIL